MMTCLYVYAIINVALDAHQAITKRTYERMMSLSMLSFVYGTYFVVLSLLYLILG